MKDRSGRTINYLRVSVTDRCNLRCQYCMPEKGVKKKSHQDILSYEDLLKIIGPAVDLGVDKIRITGGEPLVRKGIVDFVKSIKSLGGVRDLSMTTNALLLRDLAEPLAHAGLDRVNISLDSLKPETYRTITRGGELRKALEGIEAAKDAGLTPVKINAVLIRGVNDHEVGELIALSKEGIEVRFIELMPIGEAATWSTDRFLSGKNLLDARGDLVALEEDSTGVARLYKTTDGRGKVGLIDPISNHFCHQCNRIRLTADGALKPCLHSDHEIALKELLEDEKALLEALKEAIEGKPERHHMAEEGFVPILRDMVRIGG